MAFKGGKYRILQLSAQTRTKRAFSSLQSESTRWLRRQVMEVNYHYKCFSNKGCDTLPSQLTHCYYSLFHSFSTVLWYYRKGICLFYSCLARRAKKWLTLNDVIWWICHCFTMRWSLASSRTKNTHSSINK